MCVFTHIRQNFDEAPGQTEVPVLLKEGGGLSLVPNATSPTNAMHILLDVAREVVVDNMLHLRDVQASSCH